MTWDAGTITDAAPWASLSTKLKNMCGDAGGGENWDFIHNVPAGTGDGTSGSAAYAIDVFRCNGSNTKYNPVSTVNKLTGTSTVDGTSFVFAGVAALSASKVYTLAIINTKATITQAPSTVTLDGSNAPTFTKISDKVGGDATGIIRVTVWMGKSGGAAPTGTNLTVDFGGGNTQTSCIAILDEWTGLNDSLAVTGIDGTGAAQVVVQESNASGTNQTAHTATLAAVLGPKSIVYCIAGETASVGTYSLETAFTSTIAADATVATPAVHARTAFRPDGLDLTPLLTLSSASSETSWAFVSLELQRSTSTTAFTNLNDAGVDWYFQIEIPVPDGAVNSSFNCSALYESGLKKFLLMASLGAATTPSLPYYGSSFSWNTYHNVAGQNRSTTTHQALNTSGFNYWIKLTNNGVLVSTRVSASEYTNGAMLLDSFITNTTDTWPLIGVASGASATTNGNSFVTLPGVTVSPGGSTLGWITRTRGWTDAVDTAYTTNAASTQDFWASGKLHVGRVVCTHAGGATAGTSGAHDRGFLRGLWKVDFLCFSAGGTVQLGDTMTIAGNTWTVIGRTGYYGGSGTLSLVIVARAN